jgi:hypothetical protein
MLLPYHEIIYEAHNVRITWYDEAHTIDVIETLASWTWKEAEYAIGLLCEAQNKVQHPVYTILRYLNNSSTLPKGGGIFSSLRTIIEYDVPHERLVILVGNNVTLNRFLAMTSNIYGLGRIVGKYRYVSTLEAAFALIERDKASLSP